MSRTGWSRNQLLVAFGLYCQIPFGKMHSRNPDIINHAKLINRTPSALAMKLTNIASLDPAITSTGRKGLVGSSAADKAMWQEMQSDWERFALETQQAVNAFFSPIDEKRFQPSEQHSFVEEAADYTGKDKKGLTSIRVGQNFFRRSVLSAYGNRCCITRLAIPKLLIASHIIPWRVNDQNRLNPRNGLCLSALHDKAFDVGIITIAEDMTVKVSRKRLNESEQFFNSALLFYDGKPITLPEKFLPNEEFLAYHREHIFEQQDSI